jgi:hypothetical protein
MPDEPQQVSSPAAMVPTVPVARMSEPLRTASASSSDDDSETVRERRLLDLQQQVRIFFSFFQRPSY